MNEQTLSDLQKRRHTRALQIIKRWRLMDDDFMKRCLKNNIPAVECILRIIMEQPDLHVLSVTIEDTIPSLLGHGIRMDVHAVDSAGTEYDIEVQRSDKGAGARRARFNSSLLNLNSLKKYTIWNAHYGVASSPIDCALWQGTCTARLPGYKGDMDVNISYIG